MNGKRFHLNSNASPAHGPGPFSMKLSTAVRRPCLLFGVQNNLWSVVDDLPPSSFSSPIHDIGGPEKKINDVGRKDLLFGERRCNRWRPICMSSMCTKGRAGFRFIKLGDLNWEDEIIFYLNLCSKRICCQFLRLLCYFNFSITLKYFQRGLQN